MTGWLPWWTISLALGAAPVGFWIAARRPLGVSGILARFASLDAERAAGRAAAASLRERPELEALLREATEEAFAAGELRASPPPRAAARPPRVPAPSPPLSAHAVFLLALAAGGLLGRLAAGGPAPDVAGVAQAVAARLGGAAALLVLLGGGVLAGFGAALCGGCSSGHGLTGCARLAPGSLVASATFFAAAVALSLALARLA